MWSAPPPLSLSLSPAAVFSRLLRQLRAPCGMVPHPRPVCCPDRVTLFQLSAYLRRWSVHNLGTHITRLSKEGRLTFRTSRAQPGGSRGNRLQKVPTLCVRVRVCVSEHILSALTSPKRRRTLNKLRGQLMADLLPMGCTLQTLAALQVDANHKVSKAACKCLCRAAGLQTFRHKVESCACLVPDLLNHFSSVRRQTAAEATSALPSQAIVYYTESLKSDDIQAQRGSCLALKCLKVGEILRNVLPTSPSAASVTRSLLQATESVEHIVDMCRSPDEALRSAVRETVLSFGTDMSNFSFICILSY